MASATHLQPDRIRRPGGREQRPSQCRASRFRLQRHAVRRRGVLAPNPPAEPAERPNLGTIVSATGGLPDQHTYAREIDNLDPMITAPGAAGLSGPVVRVQLRTYSG